MTCLKSQCHAKLPHTAENTSVEAILPKLIFVFVTDSLIAVETKYSTSRANKDAEGEII